MRSVTGADPARRFVDPLSLAAAIGSRIGLACAIDFSSAWAGGEFAGHHRLAAYIGGYVLIVNTKHTNMTNIRRPTGRPSRGPQDRPFQMRVSEEFLRTVDDWRRRQKDLPSRAEAIRRLVELAVRLKTPPERDS
jgi:hypothetical protein